jgi:hypothetical protein
MCRCTVLLVCAVLLLTLVLVLAAYNYAPLHCSTYSLQVDTVHYNIGYSTVSDSERLLNRGRCISLLWGPLAHIFTWYIVVVMATTGTVHRDTQTGYMHVRSVK